MDPTLISFIKQNFNLQPHYQLDAVPLLSHSPTAHVAMSQLRFFCCASDDQLFPVLVHSLPKRRHKWGSYLFHHLKLGMTYMDNSICCTRRCWKQLHRLPVAEKCTYEPILGDLCNSIQRLEQPASFLVTALQAFLCHTTQGQLHKTYCEFHVTENRH